MIRNRNLTLPEFIRLLGIKNAADVFEVPPRTVLSWRRRERFPKPENAEMIIRIAKNHPYGPLTYESIYAPEPKDALKIGVEVDG